jgi:hypothetical protein
MQTLVIAFGHHAAHVLLKKMIKRLSRVGAWDAVV